MFLHETVRFCRTCDAITPHSRRRFAPARILATLLFPAAALAIGFGGAWIHLGSLLVGAALWMLLADRERSWRTPCEWCRWQEQVDLRGTRPGRYTIFNHPN